LGSVTTSIIDHFLKSEKMKKIKIVLLVLLFGTVVDSFGQGVVKYGEKYGHTLNGGVGLVYFGYVGQTVPAIHLNYEFDVARNFTLAPFLSYFAYKENTYWASPLYPARDYYYKQSVMPVGVKGTYYFDQLLNAGPNWDFYAAASLGFAVRTTVWESGYAGERTFARGSSGLYLDGHIGAEYHLSELAGLWLDLSSGISTFGLAIHLR
jgi:hypothetical protein